MAASQLLLATCPACRSRLRLKTRHAEKCVRCPKCRAEVLFATPPAPEDAVARESPPEARVPLVSPVALPTPPDGTTARPARAFRVPGPVIEWADEIENWPLDVTLSPRPTPESPGETDPPRARSRRWLWATAAVALVATVGGVWIGMSRYADVRRENESAANMWQIAGGLHGYQDCHGKPVDDIRDKAGRPLLSWRVAILPYIEQDNVYRQFHLDEPWDSPHNLPLLAKMPKTYRHPSSADPGTTVTPYQRMTGPLTLFDRTRGLKLTARDVTDGLDSTALLFEADAGVPWSKPGDLVHTPGSPLPALRASSRGHLITFADGSVRTVPTDTDETTLAAMVTPQGGEPLDPERFPKNGHVLELNARFSSLMGGDAMGGGRPSSAGRALVRD